MPIPARHIPCCIRNNAQADCEISRYGDLIKISTQSAPFELLFVPEDFARLCKHGLRLARECGWNDPEEDDLR